MDMKNFKDLKESMNRSLFESVIDKKKGSTKQMISELKKSPVLKLQYQIYSNIENTKVKDYNVAVLFLQENLNKFRDYTKNEILSENERVLKTLGEEVDFSDDKIFNLIMESTKDSDIMNFNKKAELLNEVALSLVETEVVIEGNETMVINPLISIEKLIERTTEILNEKYSFLDETEVALLKAYGFHDEEAKVKIHESLKGDILKLIKRQIFECEDEELTSKLTLTESKVKEMQYEKSLDISKFIQLINLKKSL